MRGSPTNRARQGGVGKYMIRIRPVLALERLTFLEPEGKVGYRWGRDGGRTGVDGLPGVDRPGHLSHPR